LVIKAVYTETILKRKQQKWRCVITFYSAFRRAFWVGNPNAFYALQAARSAYYNTKSARLRTIFTV